MTTRYLLLPIAALCLSPLAAQLNIITQFDPSNTGGTCGIAYNSAAGEVLVIECSGTSIGRYSEAGDFLGAAPIAGEPANDVDVDMSPVALVMAGTNVEQGQLLYMNGETDEVDIYAIDEVTMTVIDTLQTHFGVSHVVGGSYHPIRQTFFVVQDNVPGGFYGNRVAEIDPISGDTVQTFSTVGLFDVYYGDLDISPISGNLFIVSSNESGIAEFTPEGVLVTEHPLPVGVSSLSGIALDNDLQGAWVCNTNGEVFKLGNFPVGMPEASAEATITITPNPAREHMTIACNRPMGPNASIRLVDALGRTVLLQRTNDLNTGGVTVVDLAELSTGSYTLLLTNGNTLVVERLMIEQ